MENKTTFIMNGDLKYKIEMSSPGLSYVFIEMVLEGGQNIQKTGHMVCPQSQ